MTQLGLELGVQCTNHYVFYCVRFLFISLNDLVVTVVSFFFFSGILRYRVDFQSMDMDPDLEYYEDSDDDY